MKLKLSALGKKKILTLFTVIINILNLIVHNPAVHFTERKKVLIIFSENIFKKSQKVIF